MKLFVITTFRNLCMVSLFFARSIFAGLCLGFNHISTLNCNFPKPSRSQSNSLERMHLALLTSQGLAWLLCISCF